MQLLRGLEVDIEGLKIRPHTLEELIDVVGLEAYYQYIGFVSIQKKDVNEFFRLQGEEYEKTSVFQMLLFHELLAKCLVDFFEFVTRNEAEIFYTPTWKTIVIEHKDGRLVVGHKNIDQILEKIFKAYCIKASKEEKEEFNPANEQARELMERIRKNRAKAPKTKPDVDLSSIISAVAWRSNSMTIESVWKLTMYQLYDAFYRLDIIDTYDKTLTALYAGTMDAKKTKLNKQLWYRRCDI